jgi:hypothetical protein
MTPWGEGMSKNITCPIWGTNAKESEPDNGNWSVIDSPRAGGEYRIGARAEDALKGFDAQKKRLLTDWLIEQRRLGITCPKIAFDVLKQVEQRRSPSVQERADNLLRYLDHKSDLLGHVVKFYEHNLLDDEHELLAYTSSIKISEIVTLSEHCHEQKWVEHRAIDRIPSGSWMQHELMLKPPGYTRLEVLGGRGIKSDQCFVAMWFHESMAKAYTDGIAPAITDAGYKPLRIDNVEHIDKIDDRIIAEIRRSRFVVADFTSEPEKPRGGVYYEAGFAHGLNIPVIWTCREDFIGQIHFDTRQFNHIVWKTPQELREKLAVRIAAAIGDGPFKIKL